MSTQDAADAPVDAPVITPDLAALIIGAFKQFNTGNEAMQVGLLGMAAILALLPGTAKIDAVWRSSFRRLRPITRTAKP